jgi:hypothetical protein
MELACFYPKQFGTVWDGVSGSITNTATAKFTVKD